MKPELNCSWSADLRRFLGSILFLLLAWPASGQIGRYGSCEEAKSDLAAQAHMAVVKGIPHDYRAIDVIEQVRRECKLSYVGMGKHIPAFVRQLRAVRERSHKSHRIKYQELLEFRKYGYSIDPDSILQEARSAGIEADVAQQALLKSRPKREISEEQCRPRDLRGKLGPVEDQDSVISCDGYAAKALIKFKTGVDVSALDLSFLFYKDLSGIDRLMRSVFSYLSVGPALQLQLTSSRLPFTPDTVGSLAIEAGLEQGFCREEDFKSDDFEYSRKKTDFLHALQAIQGLKDSSYREHLVSLTGKSELDCEGSLRLVQTVFPGVDLSGLREILQTATTKDFVKDLASRSCKTRFFPDPKFKVQQPIYSIFSSKGLGVIQEQLDKENIVSIGYSFTGATSGKPDKNFDHASVVVGRRWSKESETCEVLIRNSYGRDHCPNAEILQCEEGHFWIPLEALAHSLAPSGVTYLE